MEHQLARRGSSIDPLILDDHPVRGFRLAFWCRRVPISRPLPQYTTLLETSGEKVSNLEKT